MRREKGGRQEGESGGGGDRGEMRREKGEGERQEGESGGGGETGAR